MSHKCHAICCDKKCKPEFLMCPRHWRMVPRQTQRLVYKYYRDGQCQLEPMPSKQWHAAADVAIAQVAEKEGYITSEALSRVIAKSKIDLEVKQ